MAAYMGKFTNLPEILYTTVERMVKITALGYTSRTFTTEL
jgi:hypothetical protein